MEEKQDARLPRPYQVVADRIVEFLERGVVPWRRPWRQGARPRSLQTGRTYRGVNLFLLETTASTLGYSSSWWLTFRQAQERGGSVRRGEKATPVVFWKMLERPGDEESDAEPDERPSKRAIPMLRYYSVFNVSQCDGIDAPEASTTELLPEPIEACERIVANMPNRPPISYTQQGRACYFPNFDRISMPDRALFTSPQEFFSTLYHELVHASGHKSRLDRDSLRELDHFGSPTYSREELVAEMGAAFLCARSGIDQATLENSAAYIDGWLKRLRRDPRIVTLAASAAQKAADYIAGPLQDPPLAAMRDEHAR